MRHVASTELSPRELVGRAGYSASRADFMELVLQCAIETLQSAEAQLCSDWQKFCDKKGATRAPRKGAKSKARRPDENALTYEIGDYVHAHLKKLPSEHRFRQVHFDFERPLASKRLAGSLQKRMDLRFEAYHADGPEFVIEAKPLFELADVDNRYLGEEGLGRFTREEEPLTRDQLGGLIGYVPFSNASDWRQTIREATRSAQGCELIVDVALETWGQTYSSRHKRPASLPPVWMLHMLVRYPPPPSSV
ncbi:MAG: hypothetical protein QM702_20140 [Rubrivivax sp.]